MTAIRVVDHVTTSRTRPVYEDEWDRGTSHQYHDIRGVEIVQEDDPFQYQNLETCFEVDPQGEYFLLVVNYDDGDSFGSDHGLIDFIDLYKSHSKAVENAEKINKHTREKGESFSLMLLNENDCEYQICTTWLGYFASFHGAEVIPVVVLSDNLL